MSSQMTDSGVITLPLPDAAARERIATESSFCETVEHNVGKEMRALGYRSLAEKPTSSPRPRTRPAQQVRPAPTIAFVSYEIHPTTWGGAGVLLHHAAVRLLESLDVVEVIHCGDIGSLEVVDLFAAWPIHDHVLGLADRELVAMIAGDDELLDAEFGEFSYRSRDVADDTVHHLAGGELVA